MNDIMDITTSNRILVVGDVMLDGYLFGTVDRISPEAPVPIVKVSNYETRLGGAANVAANIAAFWYRSVGFGLMWEKIWELMPWLQNYERIM